MLAWKGGLSCGPRSRQNLQVLWLLKEGERASPKGEPPNCLSYAKLSVLKPQTYKQQKSTQQVIVIYLCMYLYMCNNNNQTKSGY